jgi:hypothetical protein
MAGGWLAPHTGLMQLVQAMKHAPAPTYAPPARPLRLTLNRPGCLLGYRN